MNIKLWSTTHFTVSNTPPWPCPTCKSGTLQLSKEAFKFETTNDTKEATNLNEGWEPDWEKYRFSAKFNCTNQRCKDSVCATGTGYNNHWQSDFGSEYEKYFEPKFFVPALELFPVSAMCPERIKEEIFQLIINIPIEAPTIAELMELTLPRYSGARNNESAPKVFMKVPLTTAKSTNQNNSNTWYLLTCRNTNCIGKE